MLAFVLWLLAAETPTVVTKPDWQALPSAEDLEAFYPPDARMRELEGRATIQCTVTAEGTLTSCAVVSEDPAGSGFGEATVKAAVKFRMKPKTVDGKPVGGAVVRIPLRWTLDRSGGPTPEQLQAMLAEAETCVGYAQARVPGLRGSSARDLDLYRYWVAAFVGASAATELKPSEITRRLEARRVDAAASLAAGTAVPEACLKTPFDDRPEAH